MPLHTASTVPSPVLRPSKEDPKGLEVGSAVWAGSFVRSGAICLVGLRSEPDFVRASRGGGLSHNHLASSIEGP